MHRLLILALLFLPQDRPAGGAFGKRGRLPDGVRVEKDVAYGKLEKQKLDVYRTESDETRPAIVFIHGGGWRGGDKGGFRWFCGRLATEGYVVFSINYRLSGEAKYPAQIEDCQKAVRWVRENAEKYGVRKDRIASMGGSAGGHLAALVGVKDGEECRVQAVVSYFGAHDLNSRGAGNQSAPLQLIGASQEEKPELWEDASCSTHITKDDPPVLMIHGDRDRVVPLSQSEVFRKNLKAAEVEAELIVVKGAGHGLNGRDISPSLEEVDEKVLEFLKKHLKK